MSLAFPPPPRPKLVAGSSWPRVPEREDWILKQVQDDESGVAP